MKLLAIVAALALAGCATNQDAYYNAISEREKRQAEQELRAYATEADPLFFKAQRGEAEIADWQAKIQEIRQRYPYPEPPIQ